MCMCLVPLYVSFSNHFCHNFSLFAGQNCQNILSSHSRSVTDSPTPPSTSSPPPLPRSPLSPHPPLFLSYVSFLFQFVYVNAFLSLICLYLLLSFTFFLFVYKHFFFFLRTFPTSIYLSLSSPRFPFTYFFLSFLPFPSLHPPDNQSHTRLIRESLIPVDPFLPEFISGEGSRNFSFTQTYRYQLDALLFFLPLLSFIFLTPIRFHSLTLPLSRRVLLFFSFF